MSIDTETKKRWKEIQARYDFPVDEKGKPIKPKDQQVLKLWRNEGIDRFMSR